MRVVTGASVTTQGCTTVAPSVPLSSQPRLPSGAISPEKLSLRSADRPICSAIAARASASGRRSNGCGVFDESAATRNTPGADFALVIR